MVDSESLEVVQDQPGQLARHDNTANDSVAFLPVMDRALQFAGCKISWKPSHQFDNPLSF